MRVCVNSVLTVCFLICVLGVTGKRKKNNKEGSAPRWKDGEKSNRDSYQSAYEGRNLKLDCAARGRPKPKVSWHKGDVKLKSTELIKIKKHTLTFKSLSKSDPGNYTCVARNEHGKLEFTYNVDVTVQIWPLEVKGPMNLTVLEGETVKFRCRVLNDPKATISWLKRSEADNDNNGDSLDKKPEFLPNTGPDQDVLVLPNVTVKDSGKYACLAGNLWGIKYNNAWLTVVPSVVLAPKTTQPTTTTTMPTTASTTSTTTTTTTTTTTPTTTTPTPTTTTQRYWFTERVRTTPYRHFFWTEHTVTERPKYTLYPPFNTYTMEPPATKRPKNKKGKKNGRRNKDRKKHKKNKHHNMETTTEFTTYPQGMYPIPTKDDIGHRSRDRNSHSEMDHDRYTPLNENERPTVIHEDDNKAPNKTSLEMEDSRKGTIGLWTIYTIVGAIAGVILLLGLIAITVALCCRRDSNGLYKSTPV